MSSFPDTPEEHGGGLQNDDDNMIIIIKECLSAPHLNVRKTLTFKLRML